MFLLALPAGVAGDLLDRRRMLLFTQSWQTVVAFALGIATLAHRVTPSVLLLATFALAAGSALNAPAWQSILPELVGTRELGAAVTLNSISFNIARSLGPAIGGLVMAALSPAANFLLNAASFLGVLMVLFRWTREQPRASVLPAERFFGALRTGARYVRHAPFLHAVMVRGGLFVLCGSGLWALLPLVARFRLGVEAGGYGVLLGCFGAGAVAGATLLARVRRKRSAESVAFGGSLAFAAGVAVLAWATRFWLAAAALTISGGAWLTVLSGFSVAAQTAVPAWVRARSLSFYLLVFYASMAAGSSLWGFVAKHSSTQIALTTAAAGILIGLLARLRYRVRSADVQSLAPSRHWPVPLLPAEPEPDRGPVLVTLEYRIDPARAAEFVAVMRLLRRSRRRAGAVRWSLWSDAAEPDRYLESFVDESWLDHLRHRERLIAQDRDIEARANGFHRGAEPPRLQVFLAPDGVAF
jgi:predicted MFS family arabinose efflux permease